MERGWRTDKKKSEWVVFHMRQHIEYPLFSVCACCVYSLPPSVKALPDCQHYPAVFMEVWLNPVPTASRHDLILHPFSCSSQPPSIYRLQHFPLFLLTIIVPLIFVSPWCTVVYHLISHRLFLSPFFRFFFFLLPVNPPYPPPLFTLLSCLLSSSASPVTSFPFFFSLVCPKKQVEKTKNNMN